MNPGFCFAIGKKARDILYKDYVQHQLLKDGYQSFNWSFDFSCQFEEILPGLNPAFRLTIPDSGAAELQYLRDYVGFSAGLGLKANPATGFDPIANITGAIGTDLMSVGAEIGIDITNSTLNDFSAGFSFGSDFFIASFTLCNSFDSVRASLYHPMNLTSAVAAEWKHRFSADKTTLSVGAQYALFPFTVVKARINTDGEVGAVLRQQVWRRLYLSVAGEIDMRDSPNNSPRIGFSMAVKP